jgi:hypothetical protein
MDDACMHAYIHTNIHTYIISYGRGASEGHCIPSTQRPLGLGRKASSEHFLAQKSGKHDLLGEQQDDSFKACNDAVTVIKVMEQNIATNYVLLNSS